MSKWINIKKNQPKYEDYCVFAEWYPNWDMFISEYVGKYKDAKNFRKYEMENKYTHWFKLPNKIK